MSKKKLKVDFGAIHAKMSAAMTKEHKDRKSAPKLFNVDKGEYVEDVDPAKLD